MRAKAPPAFSQYGRFGRLSRSARVSAPAQGRRCFPSARGLLMASPASVVVSSLLPPGACLFPAFRHREVPTGRFFPLNPALLPDPERPGAENALRTPTASGRQGQSPDSTAQDRPKRFVYRPGLFTQYGRFGRLSRSARVSAPADKDRAGCLGHKTAPAGMERDENLAPAVSAPQPDRLSAGCAPPSFTASPGAEAPTDDA